MHIAWGSLLIVFVVAFAAAVAVVSLVGFGLVGLSARKTTPDGPQPALSPQAGTAIGAVCFLAAALIVAYGLYVIVA